MKRATLIAELSLCRARAKTLKPRSRESIYNDQRMRELHLDLMRRQENERKRQRRAA